MSDSLLPLWLEISTAILGHLEKNLRIHVTLCRLLGVFFGRSKLVFNKHWRDGIPFSVHPLNVITCWGGSLFFVQAEERFGHSGCRFRQNPQKQLNQIYWRSHLFRVPQTCLAVTAWLTEPSPDFHLSICCSFCCSPSDDKQISFKIN